MDWVIDTDVLVRAEGFDERHEHWFNINDLLGIIRQADHSIVMDYAVPLKNSIATTFNPLVGCTDS